MGLPSTQYMHTSPSFKRLLLTSIINLHTPAIAIWKSAFSVLPTCPDHSTPGTETVMNTRGKSASAIVMRCLQYAQTFHTKRDNHGRIRIGLGQHAGRSGERGNIESTFSNAYSCTSSSSSAATSDDDACQNEKDKQRKE